MRLLYINTFFLFSVVCFVSHANGQETISARTPKAAPGTYQFIITNHDTISAFTNDVLAVVESMRDSSQLKFLTLSPTVKIKIFPYHAINNPGWHAPQEIIYIETKDK